MQTFLPLPDFLKSAKVLDYKRLGKQRSEALICLRALNCDWAWSIASKNAKGYGWRNHPCVKMWKNYLAALRLYYNVVIAEWVLRGYNNSMLFAPLDSEIVFPQWFGNEIFHASHRSALLFKDFEFYSKYNWLEKPKYDYYWPA